MKSHVILIILNRASVIRFMKWKARQLNKPSYFTIEDVENLPEIPYHFNTLRIFDSTICPFCIIYGDECRDCTYGALHGICSSKSSLYYRLINGEGGWYSITNGIGEKKIGRKLRRLKKQESYEITKL